MTTPWIDSLQRELDELAGTTWHKIEVGPTRGLTFGEESVTDHNLFELDRRCAGVQVYKFDHREEALNGADFEIHVGGASAGWVGIRFQAKKLDDDHYPGIGHRVGQDRQYDLLLRGAHSSNVWPFYCFYNGWSGPWPAGVRNLVCPKNVTPIRATDHGRGCTHTRLEHFGCAIAPASRVARRHRSDPRAGRLALDDYLAMSRPWSRLFGGPPPTATRADPSRPSSTNAVLDQLSVTLARWSEPNPDEIAANPDVPGGIPANGGRSPELPGWLMAARAGRRQPSDARDLPHVAVVVDIDRAREIADESSS